MALHPDVQMKAQAELDRVIGPEGLPQISDRDALAYVTAVVREVLRWHPVVNLSEPAAPSLGRRSDAPR